MAGSANLLCIGSGSGWWVVRLEGEGDLRLAGWHAWAETSIGARQVWARHGKSKVRGV